MQSPAIADSRHGEAAGEVGEASKALPTFHHLVTTRHCDRCDGNLSRRRRARTRLQLRPADWKALVGDNLVTGFGLCSTSCPVRGVWHLLSRWTGCNVGEFDGLLLHFTDWSAVVDAWTERWFSSRSMGLSRVGV